MDKKPKILFAFTESGLGHITSMQAIKEGLEEKYNDDFEFVSIYPMNDGGPAKKYEEFMIKQVINTNGHRGLGKFIFALLELFGRQFFLRLFHRTIIKKSTDSVVKRFCEENPDIIISTNHYTTFCALEYQKRHNPNAFVATYNPDNNTHVWWDNREKVFIVNSDKAYKEALGRNFKKSQLFKVGYTVRKALMQYDLTKEESRKKYGLPTDKFTVILADGAYASANAKDFTLELLKTTKPLTLLFIAGEKPRNADNDERHKGQAFCHGKRQYNAKNISFYARHSRAISSSRRFCHKRRTKQHLRQHLYGHSRYRKLLQSTNGATIL